MFCNKCGEEIDESAKFCTRCGAPVTVVGQPAGTAAPQGSTGKKKPAVPVIAGLSAFVLAAAVGVGGYFLLKGKEVDSDDVLLAMGVQEEDESWKELTPLYELADALAIDIHAQNYAAKEKAPGMTWDSTLFYWLEDVDQTSTDDGYLAECTLSKMLFRNTESGSLMQCEVYRDPNTGEIYKVVSIEQGADEMQLVDYYYQNGIPNFTFSRTDSVYTPTYATIAKVGERYYFDNDVMVRWRMIREPSVIGEYVLTPTDAWYSQSDYFAEGPEIQASYDETEIRELNAARNTYDAVVEAGDGIGLVEGRVTNTAGVGPPGMTVDILRSEDGELLYRTVTGEDGSFGIFVYLEGVECSIVVRSDDTYRSNSIHGVELSGSSGGYSCGNLSLHRLDGDMYPVHINVYSAAEVRTGEDGGLLRDLLSGVTVSLRSGAGARTGEVLKTLETGEDGELDTTLPAGTYTAQIDVEGYATAYVTVEVAEKETTAEGYVLPLPEAGQTGIVLTWEGESDLDLTLFTPYQSTDGDMAHIGGRIFDDGHGNRLLYDNGSGCEVMHVNTGESGSYKLYVNNYTESEAGNYGSSQLSALNIHVYIYDNTGLVGEYTYPTGQTGVVWEVADISGSQVTPSQRVYNSLAGKSWWTENKWVLDLEENEKLKSVLEIVGLGESLSKEGKLPQYDWWTLDSLLSGDQKSVEGFLYECIWADNLVEYKGDDGQRAIDSAQVQDLMYALSGRPVVLDWLQTGEDCVFWFGESRLTPSGAINWRTEYVGANTWNVYLDAYRYTDYGDDQYGVYYKMSDVTITVTRNPDSCLDGYSITDIEVIPTDNSDWVQAYYNFIESGKWEEDFDFYAFYGEDDIVQPSFRLSYIDGDNVPELYIYVGYSEGYGLYTYYNGKVVQLFWSNGMNYITWHERGNRILHVQDGSAIYEDSAWIFEMINGELKQIAEGYLLYQDEADYDGRSSLPGTWNGVNVSREDYFMLEKEAFDEDRAHHAYDFYYDINEVLYGLRAIINK